MKGYGEPPLPRRDVHDPRQLALPPRRDVRDPRQLALPQGHVTILLVLWAPPL